MSEVTVIYDGKCEFCLSCVNWVKRKIEISALPFQSTDLKKYGLTFEACSKELHVIDQGATYRGAAAVALLLRLRGNTVLAKVINGSGPLGRFGYRWVAAHRGSLLVRGINRWIQ